MSEIKSPCIKICILDEVTGLCKGCFRNIEEIARWIEMSDEERTKVFNELEKRKKEFNRK